MEPTTRGPSVTEQAYGQLRDAILSGELEAGSLHSVNEFALAFGVSRTPVREAVLRLVDVGMVDIERNRGIRIRGSNVDDIRCVFEIRLLLEVPAAAVAARSRDAALAERLRSAIAGMRAAARAQREVDLFLDHKTFHEIIVESMDNPRLMVVLSSLRDATRARSASIPVDRDRFLIADEHQPIADAIFEHDADGAAHHMERHLVVSGTLLLERVAKITGEAIPARWADRAMQRKP